MLAGICQMLHFVQFRLGNWLGAATHLAAIGRQK
jgi:hypothetical protein